MTLVDTLFSPAKGTSRARRLSARCRPSRSLALERFERRDLLAITAAGIDWTSTDTFFTDFNRSMTSQYTSFTIENDVSGPAIDVWVRAVFPGGSVVGCGAGYNNEDGVYHVGELAPDTAGKAFLYLTAKSLSPNPVPFVIEVYDGNPLTAALSPIAQQSFSFARVVNTIEANVNEIDTVSFLPASPVVGDTLRLFVDGRLGNSVDSVLFAPATYTSWLPDVFELRETRITISAVDQPDDQLFFDNLPGIQNLQPFKAEYRFLITGPTTSPTPLLPTQFTQDGTQADKHHKVAGTPFPPIPPVLPSLTLVKDDFVATYVPGRTTTYTIVLSNIGNAPALGVSVTDLLPEPVSYTHLTLPTKA